MALAGRVRGSALIWENGVKTQVEFSLQGARGRYTAIAAGRSGLETAELINGRAAFSAKGICGLALAQEGRLAAVGFSAPCKGDRETLTARMRLLAAESFDAEKYPQSASLPARAEAGQPAQPIAAENGGVTGGGAAAARRPARDEAAKEAAPQTEKSEESRSEPRMGRQTGFGTSPVTLGILEQAKRLYGMLYPGQTREAHIEPRERPRTEALLESGGMRRIGNPFPASFPGWEWFETPEGTLEGRQSPDGVRRAAAYPLAAGGRIRGRGRTIAAGNGRRYYVELL